MPEDKQAVQMSAYQLNEQIVRLVGWKRRRGGSWEWGKEPTHFVYADAPTSRERNIPEPPPESYDHRSYSRIPAYIYDIALAWELVKPMLCDGFALDYDRPSGEWQVKFWRRPMWHGVTALAAPLAICLAFYEWKTGQRVELAGESPSEA